MKKKLFLFLLAIFSINLVPSCSKNNDNPENQDSSDAIRLSFKSAASYEYLTTLNNKKVVINGYMATSSPVDGSFIFLMNLPYQSCPFCKPNTSELSNTMEVYPKKNEKFSYTTSAIRVEGTLIVASSIDEPFEDAYGYQFNFKLINAEYRILKDSELSSGLALWQKVANSGLITDLYSMYDYLNFLCFWPTYYVKNQYDVSGQLVEHGFYLWPGDATDFIKRDGAQFNYGYKEGYFDNLINKINKLSSTGFETLISNINKVKDLCAYAISELDNEHYTKSELHYIEMFDNEDYTFTLNDTTLGDKFDALYYEFTDWLGSFEM